MYIYKVINEYVRFQVHKLALFLNQKTGGKLTADSITITSVAAHVLIAYLIMIGQLGLAGLLLLFFGLYDVLDGELARIQDKASAKGMLLDAATDRIKETLLYTGAAFYFVNNELEGWAAVAAFALGSTLSVTYSKAKAEVALSTKTHYKDHHQLNRKFSEGIASFELRMTIFFLGLLSGDLHSAIGLIALLGGIAMIERLHNYMKEV